MGKNLIKQGGFNLTPLKLICYINSITYFTVLYNFENFNCHNFKTFLRKILVHKLGDL